MKKVRTLLILAVCLLSLCIGLVFVNNTGDVAYASSVESGFNEEYDALYADMISRYEQNQTTYEEACEEYAQLSQNGVVVEAGSLQPQNSDGFVPFAATGSKSGTISYVPKEGAAAVPLRRVKVELLNGVPGLSIQVASAYTDYNGNFNFTYNLPNLGWFGDYKNLVIAVYAESETFRIAREWLAPTVLSEYFVLGVLDVSQGDHFDLLYHYEDSELHRAFRVSQGMAWAQRYAMQVGGMNTNKKMNIAYGHHVNVTSFCWNTFSGISFDDCNSLPTLLHEYGHFVSGAMGNLPINFFDVIFNASDFEHVVTEDHFVGKDKQFALDLAWMESWATAFAMMAYNQYNGTYGTNEDMIDKINLYTGNNAQANTINAANSGEAQELAVISFLWDLFGARNTNLTSDAWTPLGHAAFWQRTMSPGTTTLMNFANNMSSNYPQFRNQIGTRMGFFKIAPQTLTITNTPNAGTPPSFSWRVNGSQHNPNNQFRIAFYNTNGVQQYETGNLTVSYTVDPANPTRNDLKTATVTLAQSQWEAALSNFPNGGTAQVAVKGYLNSSPISGPYWSATQSISVNFAVLKYAAVNGGLAVTGVKSIPSNGVVDIPATYSGQAVVAIGNSSFSWQSQLTQITIPSSVTSIGDYAFYGSYSLKTVEVKRPVSIGITAIGFHAFYYCESLSAIIVPDSGSVSAYRSAANWSEHALRITGLSYLSADTPYIELERDYYFNAFDIAPIALKFETSGIKTMYFAVDGYFGYQVYDGRGNRVYDQDGKDGVYCGQGYFSFDAASGEIYLLVLYDKNQELGGFGILSVVNSPNYIPVVYYSGYHFTHEFIGGPHPDVNLIYYDAYEQNIWSYFNFTFESDSDMYVRLHLYDFTNIMTYTNYAAAGNPVSVLVFIDEWNPVYVAFYVYVDTPGTTVTLTVSRD